MKITETLNCMYKKIKNFCKKKKFRKIVLQKIISKLKHGNIMYNNNILKIAIHKLFKFVKILVKIELKKIKKETEIWEFYFFKILV